MKFAVKLTDPKNLWIFLTVLIISQLIIFSMLVWSIIMFLPISIIKLKYIVVFISNSHLLTSNCRFVFRNRFNFSYLFFIFGSGTYKSIYPEHKLIRIHQTIFENPIDVFLKNVKNIGQTERNHELFEKTVFRFECCHPFVFFGYFYFVKNRFDVEFGIPFGFTGIPKNFVN